MEELSQPFSTSDISPKFIPSDGNLHQSLHFGDDCFDNDSIENDDGDYNMESELALLLTSNGNDGNAVDGELVSTFVITRWVLFSGYLCNGPLVLFPPPVPDPFCQQHLLVPLPLPARMKINSH